jgi:hypothetical protein
MYTTRRYGASVRAGSDRGVRIPLPQHSVTTPRFSDPRGTYRRLGAV